jgi:hypothetical protein
VPRVGEVLKETTGKEVLNVHLNGDEAMSFGATFLASNSSSLYRMRKVYLTQPPSHDYKISISPLGQDDEAVIEDPVTPETPEGEEAEGSENKIDYHKEVMLYTQEASYLGQKKTIQLKYDKPMQIKVEAVRPLGDRSEETALELL